MMLNMFCVSSLLLLIIPAGAKPLSSLQSLKQFLDEDVNAPLEEQRSAQVDAGHWDSELGNSALGRVLGDILSTSKRSWSRFKKGGLRSCFGVRLERIGSFSGLGC